MLLVIIHKHTVILLAIIRISLKYILMNTFCYIRLGKIHNFHLNNEQIKMHALSYTHTQKNQIKKVKVHERIKKIFN